MPIDEDGLMNTECSAERINFHGLGGRRVVGRFDGGRISSDGGCVLLREVEERTHILKRLAGCFVDHRDLELIEHSVGSLVKQRVYGIALGTKTSTITIPYATTPCWAFWRTRKTRAVRGGGGRRTGARRWRGRARSNGWR